MLTRRHATLYLLPGLVAFTLSVVPVSGQTPRNDTTSALTPADHAAIRQLVADYARALGTCAADDYAAVFTADGVFSTTEFRGAKHREIYGERATLRGRDQLAELVRTEDHCLSTADTPEARSPRTMPELEIAPSPEGATGKAYFAKDGWYEDVYVKTAEGWRIKSRMVFMPPPASPDR